MTQAHQRKTRNAMFELHKTSKYIMLYRRANKKNKHSAVWVAARPNITNLFAISESIHNIHYAPLHNTNKGLHPAVCAPKIKKTEKAPHHDAQPNKNTKKINTAIQTKNKMLKIIFNKINQRWYCVQCYIDTEPKFTHQNPILTHNAPPVLIQILT